MKRALAVFLSVLMLISANVISLAAGPSFSVSLNTEKTTLQRGETFTVNITAVDITASSGLIGLDMVINYDAEKLIPVSKDGIYPDDWGDIGADFSPEPETDSENNYTGVWKTYVLYDGDNIGHGVRENGLFGIALTFKVKDDAAGGAAVIKVNTDSRLTGTSDDLESVTGIGSELRIIVEAVEKLKLKTDSAYKLENAFVKNVALGSAAAVVISNFDNETLEVRSKTGDALSESAVVGTGSIVNLIVDGKSADSAAIVVKGDTDGNGVIDATDYIIIKRHFLNLSQMSGAYYTAADIDGNGTIDSTDYIAIKRHILGISLIK